MSNQEFQPCTDTSLQGERNEAAVLPPADEEGRTTKKIQGPSFAQASDVIFKLPSDEKKKQPPFLEREIKVKNPDCVDTSLLFKNLHERFQAKYKAWEKETKKFKVANLTVTVLVIGLQLAQVIIFQVPVVDLNVKQALATILPAVTGAVLAIQLKLAWAEKGAKCKKAAGSYKKLVHHMDYRLQMHEVGGCTSDVDSIKIWNLALITENKDIPAFLSCC